MRQRDRRPRPSAACRQSRRKKPGYPAHAMCINENPRSFACQRGSSTQMHYIRCSAVRCISKATLRGKLMTNILLLSEICQEIAVGDTHDRSEQGRDHAQSDEHVSPRGPPPDCSTDIVGRSALRVAHCIGTAGLSSQSVTPNQPTFELFLLRRFRSRIGRWRAYVRRPHLGSPRSPGPCACQLGPVGTDPVSNHRGTPATT